MHLLYYNPVTRHQRPIIPLRYQGYNSTDESALLGFAKTEHLKTWKNESGGGRSVFTAAAAAAAVHICRQD